MKKDATVEFEMEILNWKTWARTHEEKFQNIDTEVTNEIKNRYLTEYVAETLINDWKTQTVEEEIKSHKKFDQRNRNKKAKLQSTKEPITNRRDQNSEHVIMKNNQRENENIKTTHTKKKDDNNKDIHTKNINYTIEKEKENKCSVHQSTVYT